MGREIFGLEYLPYRQEKQMQFQVDKSRDVATKRSIKLGRQNQQVFEVLEGLTPGERVITSSYDSFGDKDKLILK